MDRILDTITAIYYPFFTTFSLFLQVLLFVLIYTKTSKALRTMRYFLYPSNFTNTFLTLLIYFLQFRNVNNIHSLAIMCQGPCRFFGPELCFHGYILILAVTTVSGVLNIHTLYYRLVTIKYLKNLNFRVILFCGWYMFPTLIIVLSYIPPIDLNSVFQETFLVHPNYDFEKYKSFGGFANSHHICMTMVTLILVILASIAPSLGFYWRHQALKILDSNFKALSQRSVSQFKALLHGLGLQILLPLFCYVPVGFFYIYNKYSGTQILISQYLLGVMITLPAALDPILQIYFIVPYRNAVKERLLCGKRREERSESHIHTITLWQRRKSSQPRPVEANHTV